jgi:glycyl-tRNA synthetase
MAHYACDCWDAEVNTKRYGWVEVVGIADRTDFDLKSHLEKSGVDLRAFIRYDEPREVRKNVLEPDMKKLGPVFKGNASEVGEIIKRASPDQVGKDGSLTIKFEGKDLKIEMGKFKEKNELQRLEGEKIIPHVIEPSFGIDRIIYCILESAFDEEERGGEKRTILRLNPEIAPYDVAVFSLVSKAGLVKKAVEIFEGLRSEGFLTLHDASGTIGRRYARADEIGIPLAVTVDFQTLEDQTVTLRDRDSMQQKRVKIKELPKELSKGF